MSDNHVCEGQAMTREPDIVDCPKCAGHGLLKAEHEGRLVVFECADCGGQGWAAVAALEPKS
jgi:DnaJ-class molecular chaperone